MLTRPGTPPGSSWMKRLDAHIPAPDPAEVQQATRHRRWMILFWTIWVAFMLLGYGIKRAVPTTPSVEPYESRLRIAGLPLYAYGEHPRAVVAVGAFPVGLIAVGGVPVGVIAAGGLALGGIAFSGVSLGVLALGGGAFGWWAVGGGALGYYAFGGLAVGAYAYAGGGIAYGYYEASGRQKEKLIG